MHGRRVGDPARASANGACHRRVLAGLLDTEAVVCAVARLPVARAQDGGP